MATLRMSLAQLATKPCIRGQSKAEEHVEKLMMLSRRIFLVAVLAFKGRLSDC
jgi:hypothetical protein